MNLQMTSSYPKGTHLDDDSSSDVQPLYIFLHNHAQEQKCREKEEMHIMSPKFKISLSQHDDNKK